MTTEEAINKLNALYTDMNSPNRRYSSWEQDFIDWFFNEDGELLTQVKFTDRQKIKIEELWDDHIREGA